MRPLRQWSIDRAWRTLLIGAGLVLLVISAATGIRVGIWASMPYRGYGDSSALVEIPEGAGALRSLRLLEQHGVVRRFPLALTYLRLTGRTRGIKAGEYSFDRPMTPGEVFDKIVSGDVYYHRVTIMEGLRSDELFARFVGEGFGTYEEFVEAFHDVSLIGDLDDEAVDLEGYLFPDTYSLRKGTSPREVIHLMVARFRDVFTREMIEAARDRGLTVRGAVTLASLVERETARADENPLVSSVFHNRLRKRMRLECDPTVIYAMAMRNAYSGNIRKRDLRIDSRYNTYRYFGLPPGPIGNPGAAALRAAVEPAQSGYLYFVS
ncbi:MAG: endolytic transglycosylase MltG, partial [Acidobacteriota bacterium]